MTKEGHVPPGRRNLVRGLGWITRSWHPRGTDRLLRLLHDPDRRPWSICTQVEIERYRLRFNVDTASFLEWTLFFYGIYEEQTLSIIADSLRPGDTAIDVGANIGIHTAVMGRSVTDAGKVYSFEPNPAIVARLRQNLSLNHLDRVEVREEAVSDQAGTARLKVPEAGEPNQATATLARADGMVIEVAAVTLDELVDISSLKLIKIDVEGWEYPVLRGAERLLRTYHPRLLFEFAPETWSAAGARWRDAVRYLEGFGYANWALVGEQGLRPLTNEPDHYAMVVADV